MLAVGLHQAYVDRYPSHQRLCFQTRALFYTDYDPSADDNASPNKLMAYTP